MKRYSPTYFYAHSQNCEKQRLPSSWLSVRPSFRMEQLVSRWIDIHEVWHLKIYRKYSEKIQISLIFEKNNEYFT